MPIDGFIDAKAVFDALASDPVRPPTERNLLIHLLSCKDMLIRGMLCRLFWIDTEDMLTDGMTKGAVQRTALIAVSTGSRWECTHQEPVVFTAVGKKQANTEKEPKFDREKLREASPAHLLETFLKESKKANEREK